MADIEKIIDGLNLPKQLLDKSEALGKALFGESLKELGGMLADNVRRRRFNNQLKIFTKAQERIKEAGLNPQSISLKVLAPLIEFASLEEDEFLQDKWSNLISNVLIKDYKTAVQQSAVEMMNKISKEEFSLLELIFEDVDKQVKYNVDYYTKHRNKERMKDYFAKECMPSNMKVRFYMIEKDSQFSKVELHTYVAALTNHGLVQWLPKIKLQTKKEPFPSFMNDTGIQVKAGYEEGDTIKVTPFGYDFMKICKSAAE